MKSRIYAVLSVLSLAAVAGSSMAETPRAIDPPKGKYLPVPPIPAPRSEIQVPTIPITGAGVPPVIFGDTNDDFSTRAIYKTTDPGEVVFKASGRNSALVTIDEAFPEAPSRFQDFAGASINGWTPGDPDVAAGGGYVCQVVNDDYTVYDKCGNVIFTRDMNDFYSLNTNYKIFDPHIIFDPWNGRWVMIWHVTNPTLPSYGKIFVTVSRDNNPIGVGAAGWFYYAFEMVQDAGTANESFPDYYDVGYSSDLLYIAGDQFTASAFRWSRMTIFLKSEVYNEAPAYRRDHYNFNNPDGTPMRLPRAVKQQSAYANTAMFLNSRRTGGDRLTKWVISDPFGANTRVGTDIPVSDYVLPPNAIQPNGQTLDTIDCRLMCVVQASDYRNGTGTMISTGMSAGYTWSGDTVMRSVAQLYHINNGTNAVVFDRVFGSPERYYWFPSVAADYQDTAMWVFARCGIAAGEFAESRYVGFEGGTFVNSSTGLGSGTGNYSGFRWGDYFGASLDWDDYFHNNADQCRFWMNGMHGLPGSWGTHIGSTSTFSQGALAVSPATGIIAEGSQGGPFSPATVFTLTNTGQTGLRFTVDDGASWLSSNVSADELYDTPDSSAVSITVNSAANSLAVGIYNATIHFTDCANGGADITRPAQLTIRPRNNDCSDSIAIPSGNITGSNVLATGTDITTCTFNDTTDVWYRWTAHCSGTGVADTCGSTFDTSLAVFTDCTAGATQLACNDDYAQVGCSGVSSHVTWNVIAGRTYLIRVAGYNANTGTFNLYVGTSSDYNRDGIVDFFDYLDFVNDFASNQPGADFNRDGVIDFFDYLDFVQAFSTNC